MTLKVHHLRPAPGAKTAKTRVGRGEGSKGKTAGRGTKGTKARYQVPAGFEGGQMPLHMRLPKLKGFKNPFRVEYQVVNLARLAELFPDGGEVTVDDLVGQGCGPRRASRSRCSATARSRSPLQVSAHAFSAYRPGEDRRGRRVGDPSCEPAWPPRGRRGRPGRSAAAEPVPAAVIVHVGCRDQRAGPSDHPAHQPQVPSRRISVLTRVRPGVPDAGPAQEAAVHAGHHRAVPARLGHARPPASTTPRSRRCLDAVAGQLGSTP